MPGTGFTHCSSHCHCPLSAQAKPRVDLGFESVLQAIVRHCLRTLSLSLGFLSQPVP